MKATLKVEGFFELGAIDLLNILTEKLGNERTSVIIEYVKKKSGHTPKKIQYPTDRAEDGKVVAIVDSTTDEGVTPIGKVVKEKSKPEEIDAGDRKYYGLYENIGEVITEQRKRKKDFISWEDLHAEISDIEDQKGNKKFPGIPLEIIKHRLAPSQIKRAAKTQPALRGVKSGKGLGGLKI